MITSGLSIAKTKTKKYQRNRRPPIRLQSKHSLANKVIKAISVISCFQYLICAFVSLPISLLYNNLCLLCAKLVHTPLCALQIYVLGFGFAQHAHISVLRLYASVAVFMSNSGTETLVPFDLDLFALKYSSFNKNNCTIFLSAEVHNSCFLRITSFLYHLTCSTAMSCPSFCRSAAAVLLHCLTWTIFVIPWVHSGYKPPQHHILPLLPASQTILAQTSIACWFDSFPIALCSNLTVMIVKTLLIGEVLVIETWALHSPRSS